MGNEIEVKQTLREALDAGGQLVGERNHGDPLGFVVVRSDQRVQAVEDIVAKHLSKPRRVDQTVVMLTPDSFADYILIYKTDETKIFAFSTDNPDAVPEFTAFMDYHAPKFEGDNGARWKSHVAKFNPRFTEEWNRFVRAAKKPMNQTDFSIWVEENLKTITQPPSADLLELVQTLEGKRNITCNQLVRLTNGRTKLEFDEEIELKGGASSTQKATTDFPNEIQLGIAPFMGVSKYEVTARLRYRIQERKIVFWYEPVDLHLVIKDVVDEMVELITEKTGLKPLLGSATS